MVRKKRDFLKLAITSRLFFYFVTTTFLTAVFGSSPFQAVAQSAQFEAYNSPRFTLYIGSDNRSALGKSAYVYDVAGQALGILESNVVEVNRIFNADPSEKVVLRFLSPEEFRKQTGSPHWTSAMYFDGEITIPFDAKKGVNLNELSRALRHEYVHSVVAELSDRRAPAWLDEGIAQLIEGPANPILGPSLRQWSADNDILPFAWLQDGFMTLEDNVVPVAYAQSLFATRTLVNTVGFGAIRTYLALLGEGALDDEAFETAFGRSKSDFEVQLNEQIIRWAESSAQDP